MSLVLKEQDINSHTRDFYGKGQPQGTSVLLNAPSLDSQVDYSQKGGTGSFGFVVLAIFRMVFQFLCHM